MMNFDTVLDEKGGRFPGRFVGAEQNVCVMTLSSLFNLYRKLHDSFGSFSGNDDLFDVMKKPAELRGRAKSTGFRSDATS